VTDAQGDVELAIAEAQSIEGPEQWQAVERAFGLAADGGAAGRPMPVHVAFETLGALVATASIDEAAQLLSTLEHWISGAEAHRALDAGLAAQWLVVRDIVRVAALLPPRPATWLGRHAIRGRFEPAAEVLMEAARQDRRVVGPALAVLEESTSLLAPALRDALAAAGTARGPAQETPSLMRMVRAVGLGILAFFGLILVVVAIVVVGTILSHGR
jgi:hypothetical protein